MRFAFSYINSYPAPITHTNTPAFDSDTSRRHPRAHARRRIHARANDHRHVHTHAHTHPHINAHARGNAVASTQRTKRM